MDSTPKVERVYPPKLMFMVVNPIMKRLIATPLGSRLDGLARLDFEGRRSGRTYQLVVAVHDLDGRRAALTNSSWRWNFESGHPARLVRGRERAHVRGTLEAEPETVADIYMQRIEDLGTQGAERRLGIAIRGDGPPNRESLVELASATGLSVVYLDQE